jgi:LacI family transcriptional regulator
MHQRPRVALLVETSGGYGRSVLSGISDYARLHGPWSFYVLPSGHEQWLPDMKLWRGTGIIGRIESRPLARAIAAAGVPVVSLDADPELWSSRRLKLSPAEVRTDPAAAAELAGDHLIERGFRRFAFVGVRDQIWSKEREHAFVHHVNGERGFPCEVFNLSERTRARQYGLDQQQLGDWLRRLPKPLGLMTCNDDCGREVLDAASLAGVSVPDDIGVVGMDNDEVLCDLCNPPLSSIIPNARRVGYEAAALLHRLMNGERIAPQTILIEPSGLATRQSSDVVAVPDRQVAAAVHFIRENAFNRISVEDVLRAVPMSRTILERRFKKLLGHTPHDHILRVKLEKVKEMLAGSEIPLAQIAERVGFEHVEYLSVAFKRSTGETPSAYRSKQRS